MVKKVAMFLMMILVISCGTRKTQSHKETVKEESKYLGEFKSIESEKSEKKDSTYSESKKDVQVEKDRTRTTKEYDSSGRLKKETFETFKSKSKDNSAKKKVNVLKEKSDKFKYITKTVTQTIYKTTVSKDKKTDKSAPLWLLIGLPLIFGIAMYGSIKTKY